MSLTDEPTLNDELDYELQGSERDIREACLSVKIEKKGLKFDPQGIFHIQVKPFAANQFPNPQTVVAGCHLPHGYKVRKTTQHHTI